MYPIIMNGAEIIMNSNRLSKIVDSSGNKTVKKAPTTYGGTVCSCSETTAASG